MMETKDQSNLYLGIRKLNTRQDQYYSRMEIGSSKLLNGSREPLDWEKIVQPH